MKFLFADPVSWSLAYWMESFISSLRCATQLNQYCTVSLGGRIIGRDPPKPSLWPLENRSVATESSRVCNSATGWRGCLWETARLPYAHCSCCPHHKIISWMRTSAYREREALHVKLSTGKETRHRLISAHCTVVVVHVCDGAMWGL